MAENIKTVSSSFSEIKRNLDPDGSYMIFENPEGQEYGGGFEEINKRLSLFGKGVLEKKTYRDEGRGNIILVVRLSSNKAEEIMLEFLGMRFPESTAFYLYGARPKGSRGG